MPREWEWVWVVVCKSEHNIAPERFKDDRLAQEGYILSKLWVGVKNRLETGVLFEI